MAGRRGWDKWRDWRGNRCTTIYKVIASGNLLYDLGNPNRGSVTTQRGGKGGGGKEVQEGGDMCIPMTDS